MTPDTGHGAHWAQGWIAREIEKAKGSEMTDDLVERLVSLADCDARAGEPLGKCMREAADRIEELEAKLAKYDALMAEARAEGMREAADKALSAIDSTWDDYVRDAAIMLQKLSRRRAGRE